MKFFLTLSMSLFLFISPCFAQMVSEANQSKSNAAATAFLGIFFLQQYPVAGCSVLRVRPLPIRSTVEFLAPEREEFNNDKNFIKSIHKYQTDLLNEAESLAKQEGYNAIIGANFFSTFHYQGVATLGTINGNIGYGLGAMTFVGHPVNISCK